MSSVQPMSAAWKDLHPGSPSFHSQNSSPRSNEVSTSLDLQEATDLNEVHDLLVCYGLQEFESRLIALGATALIHLSQLNEGDIVHLGANDAKRRAFLTMLTRLKKDFARVKNSDFVKEGFHEECRSPGGRIKVTEKNQKQLKNLDILKKKYEEGWATEEGVIYTPQMTGLPGNIPPTAEEVASLSFECKLRGKIVCSHGSVHDADTQNKMETLNQSDVLNIVAQAKYLIEWNKKGCASPSHRIQTPSGIILNPPTTYTVEDPVDDPFSGIDRVPNGTYHLKEKNTGQLFGGDVTYMAMCDEPKCCMIGHVLVNILACTPCEMKDNPFYKDSMSYLEKRPMYTKNDPINGNFDVCYQCLSLRVSDNK